MVDVCKLAIREGSRHSVAIFVLLVFVALGQTAAPASDFPPKTYTSPSGKYSLSVDPSDREGAGKARYLLKHNGEVAWSGEEPFTFWDAFVTDDGTFGGYAYSEGYSRDGGEFIVSLLDAKGMVRTISKTPREGSHYLHTAADPKADGIFVQPENDRFVVRVRDPDVNTDAESWWSYGLGDGHLIGKSKPRDKMDSSLQYIVAARPVVDTPLTLIHWVRLIKKNSRSPSEAGARFTLVDADNKPVWTLDLPSDYTNRQDERAEALLLADIQEQGGILGSTEPARFAIRHAAAGLRVTYTATPSSSQQGKWVIEETARAAFSGAPSADSGPSLNLVSSEATLKKLSSIDIAKSGAANERPPIRDVSDFVPGEAGRFGVLENCGCENEGGTHSLTIVDDSGKLVREIPLPVVQGGQGFRDHLAWLAGDRWIVTTSPNGDRSPISSAVRIDADSGVVTPLAPFSAPSIEALAGFSDGFVALTKDYKTYTIEDTVTAFDENGNKRWDIHHGDGDGELFSPAGVAVATSGEIVVLENISNKLKIFTSKGKHRATVDLKDAWGREPHYPSGLHADHSGGVLVHDFQGSPSIVHMSLTGEVSGTFTPAYNDGRRFDIHGDVQSSPAGELWTSDGHALLRLDKQGVVDRALGDKPNFDSLGSVAAITVSRKGWIYASDERTGAVHVFNENGELQHVCRPSATDYKGHLSSPSLTVADSGDVFVTHNSLAMDARPDFLHYDAQGQRVGVENVSLDEVDQSWLSQTGTTNRWVLGYRRAYLVNSSAAVLRRLDRTADGQWVETPGPGSVAQDGSIALVSGAHGDPMSRTPPKILVTIFAADGDPVITWPAPDDISTSNAGIAFDGEHLAFVLRSEGKEKPTGILITDKRGNALVKAPLLSPHYDAGVFFVGTGAGSQLWVYDGKSSIDRFVPSWSGVDQAGQPTRPSN
jgi:hypothetical protein